LADPAVVVSVSNFLPHFSPLRLILFRGGYSAVAALPRSACHWNPVGRNRVRSLHTDKLRFDKQWEDGFGCLSGFLLCGPRLRTPGVSTVPQSPAYLQDWLHDVASTYRRALCPITTKCRGKRRPQPWCIRCLSASSQCPATV